MNDLGAVVFGSALKSRKERWSQFGPRARVKWKLVAKGGIAISGFGKGDQAPGFPAGISYGTFSQSFINNNKDIAFECQNSNF
jgi:hypothetical protein